MKFSIQISFTCVILGCVHFPIPNGALSLSTQRLPETSEDKIHVQSIAIGIFHFTLNIYSKIFVIDSFSISLVDVIMLRNTE